MTFSKSNSCATDVDVEMRNLADSTERFTLTFKKDGVLTPPDGEANAIIMLPVGAHSTLTKTFQFSGEGQYMITTEVKLKTGPGVFTLLNHVDSPEEPSVIGTLTDTSMIILTPKAWYLTLAGGTLAEEDIKVCRKEFGFSLYGMTLMPFSASTISSSSTSMAKKAPTPSSPPKK